MTKLHTYSLPFPPSLNKIWRAVGGRILLSAVARAYLPKVVNALPKGEIVPMRGRLSMIVVLHPPHGYAKRRWDIMNREKLLCDCLTKAKLWLDDSQIDSFHITRGDELPGAPKGLAWAHITELDNV